ncbi:MAG: NupC/NupG family nucleoside CNT transporter [Deltaproteobacteria bacterium]|nr:NupC/NupG family nucleoside CNT transporter [Deltaproteobacteria bacterium]
MEKLVSLLGLFVFILIAYALSEDRKAVNRRLVIWGVALQFVFALLILKTAPGRYVFDLAQRIMTAALDLTSIGASFIFGKLSSDFSIGAVFAFKVLPTVIFVSSIMAVLFHFKIIQAVIRGMAWVMRRSMGASGTETFMAASFVFMGIEAVTAVKRYLSTMTRSEVFTLMTAFMATIAGSVMAAYVSFGADAGHLLAASVMSAPAAIVISKLLVPETAASETAVSGIKELKIETVNAVDAAATGAQDGMKLALTIGAVLLAFVSIIGMMDMFLGEIGTSFEAISGYVFSPVAFIMGVPYTECFEVGRLLGIKVVFNEFLAYQKMQPLIEAGAIGPRSIVITTYALCSFANFGSLAILIGGVTTLCPSKKTEVVSLGLKAILSGCIAGFMTATIAGVLV